MKWDRLAPQNIRGCSSCAANGGRISRRKTKLLGDCGAVCPIKSEIITKNRVAIRKGKLVSGTAVSDSYFTPVGPIMH